jgi:outer membrane protein assembly factor BamB
VVYRGNAAGTLDVWQADTGNHLGSYRAAGILYSDITVEGGIAYFGGSDRRVHAVTVPS